MRLCFWKEFILVTKSMKDRELLKDWLFNRDEELLLSLQS